ncbi:MAG: aspartate carbamoyltransferase regulatory subunit, partial [Bacteroidales bacterium]|nr:aspartate carbamoyltransferase regulatory subunit [Bacteroidales bacterium]
MSNERKKELVVSAIDNGTVIDHIPANEIYKVVKILNLDKYNDEVLIGTNLSSKKFGKKGIIKVKNKFFEETEVNKISLVAPNATLIVIKDYEVVEKIQLTIPKEIKKIVKCINPNCITNIEDIETYFKVVD